MLLFTVCTLIAFLSLTIIDWHVNFFNVSLFTISWLLTLIFVFFGIYNLIFLKLHIISIPQLYLIVTFCFTSSNLFVYSLGYESAFERLEWFDENYMILAAKTIILAVLSFQIGISISLLRQKLTKKRVEADQQLSISPVLIVGAALFCLSTVYIIFSYKVVLASITQSYKDRHLLLIKSDFRFFVILTYCVLPLSNIMIYSAWNNNNFTIPHIAGIFSFLVFLVSGSRGPTLSFLLAVLFCLRVKKYRNLSNKKIMLLGCAIIFVIPTIKNLRDEGSREVYGTIPIALQGFVEMGQSIQTLSATMMIIPNLENFQYGNRYLRAILRILPSAYKSKVQEKNASMGSWLMLYINEHAFGETGGLGYLQIAELYSQFGIWGVLWGLFLLGYLTTNWNQRCEDKSYSPYGLAMSSFVLFILLLWIRADSALFRYIAWGSIAIFSGNIIQWKKQ